jgi:hypothetical protein
VQCNWGARHLVNAKDVQQTKGADNLRYEYDDHYFMTDPEVSGRLGIVRVHGWGFMNLVLLTTVSV